MFQEAEVTTKNVSVYLCKKRLARWFLLGSVQSTYNTEAQRSFNDPPTQSVLSAPPESFFSLVLVCLFEVVAICRLQRNDHLHCRFCCGGLGKEIGWQGPSRILMVEAFVLRLTVLLHEKKGRRTVLVHENERKRQRNPRTCTVENSDELEQKTSLTEQIPLK